MKKNMQWTTGLLLAGLVLVGAGCTGVDEAEPRTETEETGEVVEFTLADGAYALETEDSTLAWSSNKVGGAHNGTVALSTGSLDVVEGVITGGSFVIDMTAIDVLDLEGDQEAGLIEHLESDDFFAVADNATAEFTVTGATENTLTGDLMIKGITNEVSFAYDLEMVEGDLMLTAAFPIDRVQWEINFGSESIADRVENVIIDDEIEYDVELVFNVPEADDASDDADDSDDDTEGDDADDSNDDGDDSDEEAGSDME